MKKSVAVIGQGFVGGSLTTVLAERGFAVFTYDRGGFKSSGADGQGFVNIRDLVRFTQDQKGFSNVYFVCVPTPMRKDSSADTSIVEGVVTALATELSNFASEKAIVVKSTVPPGTTERMNKLLLSYTSKVIFNPEFLTEANALNDVRNQTHIVLGGPRPHINLVKQVFQMAFPKVPIVKTNSTTAEMMKYLINCFLSVKVSFANEMAQVCEALDASGLDVDYDKVVEYAKMDSRIGTTHWSVPGPVPTAEGKYVRGFGGHCFPKDINALMYVARELGVHPDVMAAAWEKNLEVRGSNDRDWEKMKGRAVSE